MPTAPCSKYENSHVAVNRKYFKEVGTIFVCKEPEVSVLAFGPTPERPVGERLT